MNMRKIIAVLAAVLLLCAAIPMAAISVSASNGDVIVSSDFEDGTVGSWTTSSSTALAIVAAADLPVANENGGNYALYFESSYYSYVNYQMTVKANTTYKISIDVLSNSASNPVNIRMRTTASSDAALESYTPVTDAWTTYSYVFNSGTNTTLHFRMQAGWSTSKFYFDNISCVEYVEPEAPVLPADVVYYDGLEESSTTTWGSSSGGSLEIVDASSAPVQKATNGYKVLKHVVDTDKYPYVYNTQGITVEPNTDYVMSIDLLNTSTNWPIKMQLGTNYWTTDIATSISQQIKPSTTTWETYSFVFNSGDNTKIYLFFRSEWASTTIYADNIYVAPLHSVADDGYIMNGDFETGTGLEWLHTSNTEIIADPTESDQGYVINTSEATSGAHMFSQPAENLVVGEEYVLSFKVYGYASVTNSAFWVRFPSAFTTWSIDTTYSSATGKYNNYTPRINVNSDTNAWHEVNITFTAQAATALIDFMNYRASAGSYYFDDISITHVHNYEYACSEACSVCGEANPDAVAHTEGDPADCVNDQTCTVCGEVLATAVGHTWNDATCTDPKTCSVCGATEGEALGHAYDYDCDADCNVCGATREAAHSYYYPCDPVCQICYEITNPDATHNIVAVEAVAATCTENGNVAYWYCADCGQAWLDEAQTQLTNQRNVIIPAGHTYDNNCDGDCNVCGEYRDAPHNLTTHVEAVVPANCQEEGYNEHWICEDCGGYFMDNGAGGYYETNPAWMYYTGEHVRPEGAAGCAVVACTLCGEDSYGSEACVRPEGSYLCQNDTCVNCGGEIYGEGCTYGYDEDWNPLSPFCQPGDCIYCGTHYEYLYEHENGSYAPCSVDGECVYGCGLEYPATGEHAVDNPCEGGLCWMCWEEIPAADHEYDNAFDVDCNVCGATRDVVCPVAYIGKSISEDVSGYAVLFDANVEGLELVNGAADYTNATYEGYKLLGLGVTASNGKSSATIEGERVYGINDETGKLQFAFRIVNIPESGLETEITMVPYYVVEIDGVATTIEGEAVVGSYAEIAG